jgi:peptide/nickel transport system permease protein
VRGRFLSLREEDFIGAAELDGASNLRIIFRYLLPSIFVVVSILAFNFVGDGLRDAADPYGHL